jgi:hypothetical protein
VTAEAAEAEHLMNALDFMDAATKDVQGGVTYLGTAGPRFAWKNSNQRLGPCSSTSN